MIHTAVEEPCAHACGWEDKAAKFGADAHAIVVGVIGLIIDGEVLAAAGCGAGV